jgi:hypothetical protein
VRGADWVGHNVRMTEAWTPELRLQARADGCRLSLVGVTYGNGASLQDAGNDLLVRLFDLAVAVRAGGLRLSAETGHPDHRVLDFLWEVGELAARGGDLRQRVFGVPKQRSSPE